MSSNSDSGDDWAENDENLNIPCLFCEKTIEKEFPSALQHIETEHKLNFSNFIRKHTHDTYSYIKLINFIRRESVLPEKLITLSVDTWDKDEYLHPAVEDDPWLMYGKCKKTLKSE